MELARQPVALLQGNQRLLLPLGLRLNPFIIGDILIITMLPADFLSSLRLEK